ncbi:hypothetical protein CIPAW_07G073600 [Carya illinoinensis]|uniref:Uncharacterized protein n=1 Tax=Carya illinoinensis TaxID=32201 RepID=A0A8T1PW00_CARIL|nr:hypothetical protein CIPAW_07G073600 [Carya illinoinensis]
MGLRTDLKIHSQKPSRSDSSLRPCCLGAMHLTFASCACSISLLSCANLLPHPVFRLTSCACTLSRANLWTYSAKGEEPHQAQPMVFCPLEEQSLRVGFHGRDFSALCNNSSFTRVHGVRIGELSR